MNARKCKCPVCPTSYVVSFIAAAILTVLIIVFNKPLWQYIEEIGSLATAIATFIAAVTLIFGYREFLRSEIREKRQKTFDFVAKYYDTSFVQYTSDIRKIIMTEEFNPDDILNDYELRSKALVLFNYFEDMAYLYQKNLVDGDILKELMNGPVCNYYHKSRFLIDKMREKDKQNNTILSSWEDLYKMWKNRTLDN